MKLANFELNGRLKLGVLVDNRVLDVAAANEILGLNVPTTTLDLLNAGSRGLKSLESMVGKVVKGKKLDVLSRPVSRVKLGPPVPNPKKIFLLAGNYMEHIRESQKLIQDGMEIATPRVFMKPPTTTIAGNGDPIIIPKVGVAIDWEVELAVVMGKKGRYIPASEAYDYVYGYMILNDVSERKFDAGPRTTTKEWDSFFDWLNGKWFDGFAPSGPWLVTKDEIPNPHKLSITLKVNGEVMQSANTGDMIFDIPKLVEFISRIVTFEPGDIISTGTPSGVGAARNIFLKEGDTVECEIEKIGRLVNPVSKEE